MPRKPALKYACVEEFEGYEVWRAQTSIAEKVQLHKPEEVTEYSFDDNSDYEDSSTESEGYLSQEDYLSSPEDYLSSAEDHYPPQKAKKDGIKQMLDYQLDEQKFELNFGQIFGCCVFLFYLLCQTILKICNWMLLISLKINLIRVYYAQRGAGSLENVPDPGEVLLTSRDTALITSRPNDGIFDNSHTRIEKVKKDIDNSVSVAATPCSVHSGVDYPKAGVHHKKENEDFIPFTPDLLLKGTPKVHKGGGLAADTTDISINAPHNVQDPTDHAQTKVEPDQTLVWYVKKKSDPACTESVQSHGYTRQTPSDLDLNNREPTVNQLESISESVHLVRDSVATKSSRSTSSAKLTSDPMKTIPDSGASKPDSVKISQNVHNITNTAHKTSQVQRSAGATASIENATNSVPSVGKAPAIPGPALSQSLQNRSQRLMTNSGKTESENVKTASYHIGTVSHSVKPILLPMKTVSHPKANTSLHVKSMSHPFTTAHPVKASTSPLFQPLTTVVRWGRASIPFRVVPNPVERISLVPVVGLHLC